MCRGGRRSPSQLCVFAQGFTWAIVSREASSVEANSISKPDNFYAAWRVGNGALGGGLSTIQSYSESGDCGAATYSQSDLTRFQVWVGALSAGEDVRPLTAYINGAATGWQNRWAGCVNSVVGSVNMPDPVYVGSSLYSGEFLEVVVWKGATLRFVLALHWCLIVAAALLLCGSCLCLSPCCVSRMYCCLSIIVCFCERVSYYARVHWVLKRA